MMTPRIHGIWLVIGLCLLNTGCGIVTNFCRNIILQPAAQIDECRMEKRNHELAEAAWAQAASNAPERPYSEDFADGFIAGYADYLSSGGKGNPPSTPPWGYLTVDRQIAAGHQAAQEWFAGFRHGSAAAIASGQREWITVPMSTRYLSPRYSGADFVPLEQPAAEETLPSPRLIEPAKDKVPMEQPPGSRLPARERAPDLRRDEAAGGPRPS
jgi:hypothetical protein